MSKAFDFLHSDPWQQQGSPHTGLDPRNQVWRLPAAHRTRRRPCPADHPQRLRLGQALSLDCRSAL